MKCELHSGMSFKSWGLTQNNQSSNTWGQNSSWGRSSSEINPATTSEHKYTQIKTASSTGSSSFGTGSFGNWSASGSFGNWGTTGSSGTTSNSWNNKFGSAGTFSAQANKTDPPPISTAGSEFDATEITDKSESTQQMQQYKIKHILMIKHFQRFTLEEIRYYDYLTFGKIDKPQQSTTSTGFQFGAASSSTTKAWGPQSTSSGQILQAKVFNKPVTPWSISPPDDLEKVTLPNPDGNQQPYGSLPATKLSSVQNHDAYLTIKPNRRPAKLHGFSRKDLSQADQLLFNQSILSATPGITELHFNVGSISSRSESAASRSRSRSSAGSRSQSSSSTMRCLHKDIVYKSDELQYADPESERIQRNYKVAFSKGDPEPSYLLLFPGPIDISQFDKESFKTLMNNNTFSNSDINNPKLANQTVIVMKMIGTETFSKCLKLKDVDLNQI